LAKNSVQAAVDTASTQLPREVSAQNHPYSFHTRNRRSLFNLHHSVNSTPLTKAHTEDMAIYCGTTNDEKIVSH
jgi:hypothetical protein